MAARRCPLATKAAQRWMKLVDEHEASGLTLAEFSRRKGINSGSLSWWRGRLGRTRKRGPQAAFLEVVVSEPAPVGLQVRLPARGVEFIVDEGTSLGLVRKVVEALC